MLNTVPESDVGSPLTVFTYRNYPFDRSTNIAREWTALLASGLKIIEFCTLWVSSDRTLCWVSNIAWLYFFIAALTVQFRRQWRGQPEDSGSDRVDILAGQLPTPTRPGGHRKLLLGTSDTGKLLSSWRIIWGIGSVISLASMLTTYMLLSRTSDRIFYVWSAFQMGWLVLLLMFYHFSDATDPMAYRLLVAQAPWKDCTTLMKERVLDLTLALAKYQMHFHPRGIYCYDEDLVSARTLCSHLSTISHHLQSHYPLDPHAKPGDTLPISVHAIVGDTILTSASWLFGHSLTGMDLYDTCLLFLNVHDSFIAVPAARVLSDPLTTNLDVESSIIDPDIINKGSTNTGAGITWWYWIPCGPDRWLQARTEDVKFLGHRTAKVTSDTDVTETLEKGRLIVSLKNVEEVRDVVELSVRAGKVLIDIVR